MLVVDPLFFRSLGEYRDAVDFLFAAVKRAIPVRGTQGVLIPGEPELIARVEREKNGIPIDDQTWSEIMQTAVELKVDLGVGTGSMVQRVSPKDGA